MIPGEGALERPGFDLAQVRGDFPYLELPGDPIIYLDNAATSQRPKQVIEAVAEFYRSENGNPLRGAHRLGIAATDAMQRSRSKVADFINCRPEEVVFTKNASESLNLVAYAWGLDKLEAGDEILISRLEHHSNCVPWQFVAQQTGAKLIYIELTPDYQIDQEDFRRKLTDRTKVLSISAASNVLATLPDLDTMIAAARAKGALVVVDAAQYAPHHKLDVRALDCDFLAFSGHKMLAPMGIGVLYGKKEILADCRPFLYGGEMIEYVEDQTSTYTVLPYRFEAGTQDVAGMVGLAAAIDYLEAIGLDKVMAYEAGLTDYCLKQLEELDYIDIYHSSGPTTAPVIAFNVQGAHPHDVATILDNYGVAIRAGHHCTQPLHRWLGQNSTNRVSFAFYNTKEEVDQFIKALAEVTKILQLT